CCSVYHFLITSLIASSPASWKGRIFTFTPSSMSGAYGPGRPFCSSPFQRQRMRYFSSAPRSIFSSRSRNSSTSSIWVWRSRARLAPERPVDPLHQRRALATGDERDDPVVGDRARRDAPPAGQLGLERRGPGVAEDPQDDEREVVLDVAADERVGRGARLVVQ